jgi:hypothetical protein
VRGRQSGAFSAACIVWVRPDGEEDEEEGVHFGSVEAHEFGMAPMMARDRNNLSGANDNLPFPIPFVPVTMAYTFSEPGHPIACRVAQTAKIPTMPLIVNATNEHGAQLVDVDPPIHNLELNLSMYVRIIHRHLPPHEEGGVDDDDDEEEEEEHQE